MGVGYRIELGYGDGEWEDLKEAALAICNHPERIVREAMAFGAPVALDGELLDNYAESFRRRVDATIDFVEPGSRWWQDDYETPFIHMMASGGDPARTMKEHTRRAFLRLIMAAMHRQNIEISIKVS